jgi:sugar phosphate isomerase/epimerase
MLGTDMILQRRRFLTAALALGATGIFSGCAASLGSGAEGNQRKLDEIGIQIYTVRKAYAEDPIGTLKMLAALGYTQIEYGAMPEFKISHKEARKICSDLGMIMPSGIYWTDDFRDNPNKIIDYAGDAGHKYVIDGWIKEDERGVEGYKKVADKFNRWATDMRKAGFGFAYHNHEFEFDKIDGETRAMDILMQNTDPALVKFELDMYWAVAGGADNVEFINQYPGRFMACHIKDRTADGKMVSVGDGVIPWAEIFNKNDKAGFEYFFVEDDEPPYPVREPVKRSIDYLRALRF